MNLLFFCSLIIIIKSLMLITNILENNGKITIPMGFLCFFFFSLHSMDNEKTLKRTEGSFYKKISSPPPKNKSKLNSAQDSPIGRIEAVICPAIEMMSGMEAKRTYYYDPLELKKYN